MILIIDGDYNDVNKTAHMAGVLLNQHTDSEIAGFITADIKNIAKYESGSFYKRELQGVKAIIDKLNYTNIDLIIVDGFAKFDDGIHQSLGEYVNKMYDITVIGVAKKWCDFCKVENTEIYRGISNNPLFVTTVGGNNEQSKTIIKEMFGDNRIPYAIKLADSFARKNKVNL